MVQGFEKIDRQESEGFAEISTLLDDYNPDDLISAERIFGCINDGLSVLAKLHVHRAELI